MPRLIITADDCGLSEGVNLTTLDLHRRGYISAASVMTNFPACQHALDIFRGCPDLDIGVHLTLTDGFPVTRRGPYHWRLLKHDGGFRDKFSLYLRGLFFRRDAIGWIRQELDAQLRRCVDAGVRPQHISTHHHFHSLPILREIVHELAALYQVDWVRGHDFRATITPHAFLPRPQHQSSRFEFYMPDFMTGLQAWMSRPVGEFSDRVRSFAGTVEIVAHPGATGDAGFPESMNYGPAPRQAETRYLIKAIDQLRAQGIAP